MQWRQRFYICLGIVAMVFMGLYPPWVQVFSAAHLTKPLGYAWLFWPPSVGGALEIDFKRLLLEWAMIGLVTVALALASKSGGQTVGPPVTTEQPGSRAVRPPAHVAPGLLGRASMARLLSSIKKGTAIALVAAALLLWLYAGISPDFSTADALRFIISMGGWCLSFYLFVERLDLQHERAQLRRTLERVEAGLEALWPKLDEGVKIKLNDALLGWVDTDARENQLGRVVSDTRPGGATLR